MGYLNMYSILALVEDTIPEANTSSLCNPRNEKLIGTVQHLTSRPGNHNQSLGNKKFYDMV